MNVFQLLRGATAKVLAYIPAEGQLLFDTSLKQLRVGDSVTAGGTRVASPIADAAVDLLAALSAANQRLVMQAAKSGINADITSIQGLTTALSVAQGGTGGVNAAAARSNLQAAASGANADITALSGLTTALSAAQGGTGVTSLSALLTALQNLGAYSRGNVLGTVSQSAGVPTGAIIETISNQYGSAIKYANGTLVCTSQGATNVTTASIAANSTSTSTWTLPAAFVDPTFVVMPGVDPTTSNDHYGAISAFTASNNTFTMVVRNGGTAQTFKIKFTAIGRWF